MPYIQGFVVPVRTSEREAYRKIAAEAAAIWKEHGATAVVECWGDDVPDGKVTSFPMAVKLQDGETVVFSWSVWPSQEARDAGNEKMMEDPRMQPQVKDLPFDPKRMIFGGFRPIVEARGEGPMGYVDGFVVPVRTENQQAFRIMAAEAAALFQEHGATAVMECWGDDVPDGEVTSFPMAAKLDAGESVVFAWIAWPSKAAREAGNEKVMADPRMQPPDSAPFDTRRMFWGGFEPIVEA